MHVCMLKVAFAVLPTERGNRLGQGERSLCGPIFPTPQAKLARGTPPTPYFSQSAGSAANFALGLSGLPREVIGTNRVYPGQFQQPDIQWIATRWANHQTLPHNA